MINGFVLEINNEIGIEYEIPLFLDFTLPDGLSIRAHNSNYDYQSLHLMAKIQGFKGSGFKTTFTTKVKIFNKNQIQEIEIENFHTDTKIVIDGFENYISIVIPPFANGLFQLMPYFE
jgi:hypothetical protein